MSKLPRLLVLAAILAWPAAAFADTGRDGVAALMDLIAASAPRASFAGPATLKPESCGAEVGEAVDRSCRCSPPTPKCVNNNMRREYICCPSNAVGCVSPKKTWCCSSNSGCLGDDGGCR